MQYLGGKSRTAKQIAKVLSSLRGERRYVEPFVGGGWVLCEMVGDRSAYDKHPDLVMLYKELQAGWIPPSEVSENQYKLLKNQPPSALRAFVGFGCSFSGMFFGGYARSKQNYALSAKNSLLKKKEKIKNVTFCCVDYKDLYLDNCLVYCDPPYEKARGYTVGKFDHRHFWDTMRAWSKNNIVVVSSYSCPDDFRCIAEFNSFTELRCSAGRSPRVEKLFMK